MKQKRQQEVPDFHDSNTSELRSMKVYVTINALSLEGKVKVKVTH